MLAWFLLGHWRIVGLLLLLVGTAGYGSVYMYPGLDPISVIDRAGNKKTPPKYTTDRRVYKDIIIFLSLRPFGASVLAPLVH